VCDQFLFNVFSLYPFCLLTMRAVAFSTWSERVHIHGINTTEKGPRPVIFITRRFSTTHYSPGPLSWITRRNRSYIQRKTKTNSSNNKQEPQVFLTSKGGYLIPCEDFLTLFERYKIPLGFSFATACPPYLSANVNKAKGNPTSTCSCNYFQLLLLLKKQGDKIKTQHS